MNTSNLATTLIQATNIVLLLLNSNVDIRKFAAWRIDTEKPEEVLTGLETLNASFEDTIKLFEHPLETGAVITDHYIVEPNSVNIEAVISNDDAETLKELEYLRLNGIPLKIRCNNKVIPRAVIKDLPFHLDSSMFDKTKYSISFRQEEIVDPVYVAMPKAKKKADTSRVNSGVKQAEPKKKSWLKSAIFGGRT